MPTQPMPVHVDVPTTSAPISPSSSIDATLGLTAIHPHADLFCLALPLPQHGSHLPGPCASDSAVSLSV